MSPIRRLSAAPSPPVIRPGLSEASLERAGLKGLFADGPVAFRRVDAVTSNALEVDGARLPRSVAPAGLKAGQWLRFERRPEGVSVRVDLRATLDGEQRFNELLSQLVPGWRPPH